MFDADRLTITDTEAVTMTIWAQTYRLAAPDDFFLIIFFLSGMSCS